MYLKLYLEFPSSKGRKEEQVLPYRIVNINYLGSCFFQWSDKFTC